MSAWFTPEAAADVGEARRWYASLRARLAREFLAELDHCVEAIDSHPRIAPQVAPEIRRILLRRFPYCVFYVVESGEVVVLACLHGRRSPTAWRIRQKR